MTDRKIVSIGAYDRFNYGDLLFPLVLDHVAQALRLPSLDHFSVRNADMTRFGGVHVKATREGHFLDASLSPERSCGIILGGGELVGSTWGGAASGLVPMPLDFMLLSISRFISPSLLNYLSKLWLRGIWATPFVPNLDLATRCTLVTNAVGASSLTSLDASRRDAVVAALGVAKYVSVRDATGQELLRREKVESTLAPDSAAILGRLRKAPPRITEGVLVFQCSLLWLAKRSGEVVNTLEMLSKQYSCIKLLPIGLAGGHADQYALRALYQALRHKGVRNVVLINVSSIWNVAEAIAGGDVFVGTSLHGNITAMAYGVPTVGLNGVAKLDAYLKTWGRGLSPFAVNMASLQDAIDSACAVDDEELTDRASRLDELAWANTTRVLEVSGGGETSQGRWR